MSSTFLTNNPATSLTLSVPSSLKSSRGAGLGNDAASVVFPLPARPYKAIVRAASVVATGLIPKSASLSLLRLSDDFFGWVVFFDGIVLFLYIIVVKALKRGTA